MADLLIYFGRLSNVTISQLKNMMKINSHPTQFGVQTLDILRIQSLMA